MGGGITFAHHLAGQKDGFDKVIKLGAGADAGEIGADAAAGAAQGVALEATERGPTKDTFAARGIALALDARDPAFHVLRVKLAFGARVAQGFLEHTAEFRCRHAALDENAQTDLGGVG